ncbi:MAG: type I DNA topoisomerase [Christensenellaceae bacterium]|jgi:DNA topoisomerase-1
MANEAAAKKATKSTAKGKTAAKKTAAKKNLVIVESPAKAKTIEKFLGKSYVVRASNGHLRDLPKSKIGVDVEHDFEPQYIAIRGKGDLIKKLKDEAKKSKKVYLATDPDREGEAISWHIANMLNLDPEDSCRIEFNEITKSAVESAIKQPRQINMDLVDAQQARRVLDRLVGYKLSPLLWKKVKKGLSAGRVQSVAVKIIVDREKEIRDFVPEEYWTISAFLKKDGKEFEAKYFGENGKKVKLADEASANKVLDAIRGADFIVQSVKQGTRKKNALPPFITSSLQQAASAKLGFTAKKTMMVAQMLYEGVPLKGGATTGLISYMRTDSTRIAEVALDAARTYISAQYGKEYLPEKANQYKGKKGAQDAHEAIRPTDIEHTPDSVRAFLNDDQYKLYKLIYTRFLASQMNPAVFETLSYDIDANGQTFRASGSRILFDGHLAAYDSSTDEDKQMLLPKAEQNDKLALVKIDPKQNFTQPPQRYTEAGLVKFMEERGIGRPSTYAPIISTIQDRGYVKKKAKSFYPTELGEIVTELMANHFSDIVDVSFTADMEEELDDVENDGTSWKKVIRDFYMPFEKDLEAADKNIEDRKVETRVSDVVCEKCGAQMVYKEGRFGEFLACPNYPKCKNTKRIEKEKAEGEDGQVQQPSDVICEKCGAQMIVKVGKFGEFLACPNYPECKNTKQIAPDTGIDCPKCGGKVVIKRSKNRRVFYGCENYPKCDFVSWNKPLNEKCTECGEYMVEMKARDGQEPKHKCSNPECATNKSKKSK